MAKLALPVGMTPSAIGLFLAPPIAVAVDVEEVVDQPHDQLGHQHRGATDDDLPRRSSGERDERADGHAEGERLTRVDRPHERRHCPGALRAASVVMGGSIEHRLVARGVSGQAAVARGRLLRHIETGFVKPRNGL